MADDAVPDPRFRDQLFEWLLEHSPVYSEVYDEQRCACGSPIWDGIDAHRADVIAAEVEARVQAAANQRAAEELEAMSNRLAAVDHHSAAILCQRRANALRTAALTSPAPAPHAEEGQ